MGLFKSKEEKEQRKQEKELKKEASLIFMGESLQPIGKIASGKTVGLTLKPNEKVLNIHHDKIDITLPYERLKGFKIEDETTLAKSGSTIGRALVGGALFGKTGAIVGGMSAKGNTNTKWIATLIYEDKEGNLQELNFIQWGLTGHYEGATKHFGASQFEDKINEIVSRYGEDITEL
jgi:hypothetical protein